MEHPTAQLVDPLLPLHLADRWVRRRAQQRRVADANPGRIMRLWNRLRGRPAQPLTGLSAWAASLGQADPPTSQAHRGRLANYLNADRRDNR